ncbi:MAG: AAA family ATPase, partial [Myxococcota bacterium]
MDIIAPMTIGELAVTNYRSIRELRIELGTMTVVVGRNGSGKSNLYRSMVLLAAAAEGRLARTLLEEGGMPSVLWAGPRQTRGKRKREPVRMIIEVTLDELHYTLEFGLPKPSRSAFALDPEIKAECVWTMDGRRKVVLAERKASSAWVRDDEGHRETYAAALDPAESMLAQLKDPRRFPVLGALRTAFTQWRFYHHFHSHVQAAARQRQAGVRTPVLASDGSDLGAALQT